MVTTTPSHFALMNPETSMEIVFHTATHTTIRPETQSLYYLLYDTTTKVALTAANLG